MIANPCDSTLVPGLYGSSEGFLARLKNEIYNASAGSAGFILWSPRYHNKIQPVADGTYQMNVFAFSTNDPSVSPGNSPGYGGQITFDQSLTQGTVLRINDPAAQIVGEDNAIVLDARTLSACLRLTYSGRMDSSSGQVAFIENVPVSALLGDPDQKEEPMSVDDLFRLSSSTQRLGVDTMEIVYRSHEVHDATFHDSKDGALWVTNNFIDPTTVSSNAVITSPHVFGFAWRNLDVSSGSASLAIGMVKNIEWRPSPTSGFTAVVPHTMSVNNQLAIAHLHLDKVDPAWTKRILDNAGSVAGSVAKMAATGVANWAKGELNEYLKHPEIALPALAGLLL
jgi:hypothetical protein